MLPLPPALYSSMITAITATIMTMAPPTNLYSLTNELYLVRMNLAILPLSSPSP
jgi:hypothetical protein